MRRMPGFRPLLAGESSDRPFLGHVFASLFPLLFRLLNLLRIFVYPSGFARFCVLRFLFRSPPSPFFLCRHKLFSITALPLSRVSRDLNETADRVETRARVYYRSRVIERLENVNESQIHVTGLFYNIKSTSFHFFKTSCILFVTTVRSILYQFIQ